MVSTFAAVNDLGSKTILLLKSLYFTTILVWIPGCTSTLTLSSNNKPWVDAVATVTTFLFASPVTTKSFMVLKLWYTPVPNPVNLNRPPDLLVLAIPTKVPVDPKPTLKVEIPIRLLEIFPT